jgi:glycosyltransferase involved in cell wall biosynthesis
VSANGVLRVGLDLDGSLESLGNSMTDLADALTELGTCELIRFRTVSAPQRDDELRLALRSLWSPLWRRSLGRSLDGLLPPVDVVHVAGLATPPTKKTPLIISVDDLRPFREESRTHQRVTQLRRAVAHGAMLVASTRTASHEVIQVLGVARHQVVVVPPAVPRVSPTANGRDLVVNVTGLVDRFLSIAPALAQFCRSHDARLVALTSAPAGQRVRATGVDVDVRSRRDARSALGDARVVLHISDGARFPSFAIAALTAGVPTVARATSINRELLAGAAALAESDEDMLSGLEEIWSDESRRAIMLAAGHARAVDFAPSTAARAYSALYHDVVRGWVS